MGVVYEATNYVDTRQLHNFLRIKYKNPYAVMYTDTGGYLSLFRGLSLDSVDRAPQQRIYAQQEVQTQGLG